MTNQYWMYLSLWKEHGGAPGLGLFSVDADSGEITFCRKLDNSVSFGCSFVDQKRNILYLCNEEEKVRGVQYDTGRIYGYKISPEDGSLTELFCRETYCPNPSYIGMDASGDFLVVAHHSPSGAVAKLEKDAAGKYVPKLTKRESLLELFSVNADGTVDELLDVKTHQVDQTTFPRGSFLHCAVFSPSGNLFAVCDKGDGCVYLYTIDRTRGELRLLSRTPTDVHGAHPRYCVFHPTKPYFVVNHEQMKDNRMMVCSFCYTESGEVERISAVNVLPADCEVPPHNHFEQQGMCMSMDGSYIYTCLNGPNTVAVLSIDGASGELRLVQNVPTEGEWPRGLALMPGGKFVVASSLVSGDITVYSIGKDGCLQAAGSAAKLRGGAYMSFCEKA